jgi:Ca2+/H+ antiporter, TMEM165/GDT1 family
MNVSPLVTAFSAVLLAETIADRSLYTISSLTTRFRAPYVAIGVSIAFVVKMGVAVLAGHTLAALSPSLVSAVSAAAFFATAIALFLRRTRHVTENEPPFAHAASVSFAAIFFTEWCDIGQVTAAMITARFGAPLLVWTGASAAVILKGLLALTVAARLRNRIRSEWLRYGACATCVVLGVLAILRID